jgi:hypothetical protein
MTVIKNPPETAIVITPPKDGSQVLIRLPGHIDPADVHVDFRPNDDFGIRVWTPSGFFDNSVEVRHQ